MRGFTAFESCRFARNYMRTRRPPGSCLAFYKAAIAAEAHRPLFQGATFSCIDLGAGVGVFSDSLLGGAENASDFLALEPASAMYTEALAALEGTPWKLLQAGIPLSTPNLDRGLLWISDVVHLFPPCGNFLRDVHSSFPRIDSILLRLHVRETVQRCEWGSFFPQAFLAEVDCHDSLAQVITTMEEIGYSLSNSHIVDESFVLSPADYISYFENRSISRLYEITDAEFGNGLELVRAAASGKADLVRSVWRQLLVFRRNA